jgi:hypothetical protein
MPRLSSHFGLADPRLQTVSMPMILPVTLTAATVLTPAQALSGLISCNATVTLTLPSAAALCEAIQGCMVGTSFEVMVRSTGAGNVTVAAGTGGTIVGTATVATVNIRTFLVNLTNVTVGQEAYTVYSEGQAPY